jgi:hypothetical protein
LGHRYHHTFCTMAPLTEADVKPQLKDWPTIYELAAGTGGDLQLFDVLLGEDTARPLMEASKAGDNATVQGLLSQPEWINKLSEKTHIIYGFHTRDESQVDDSEPTRSVFATPMPLFQRALTAAALNGHGTVASTLLTVAKAQGMDTREVLSRPDIPKLFTRRHEGVIEALAKGDPTFLTARIGHSNTTPLFEAAKRRLYDAVVALLEAGADPLLSAREQYASEKTRYPCPPNLLYFAAGSDGPRVTQMLLDRGVPVQGTGALHAAAYSGRLEDMRALVQHGADVNEALVVPESAWKDRTWAGLTPMQVAALNGQEEAMKWLENNGPHADAENKDGMTPDATFTGVQE